MTLYLNSTFEKTTITSQTFKQNRKHNKGRVKNDKNAKNKKEKWRENNLVFKRSQSGNRSSLPDLIQQLIPGYWQIKMAATSSLPATVCPAPSRDQLSIMTYLHVFQASTRNQMPSDDKNEQLNKRQRDKNDQVSVSME